MGVRVRVDGDGDEDVDRVVDCPHHELRYPPTLGTSSLGPCAILALTSGEVVPSQSVGACAPLQSSQRRIETHHRG